MSCAKFRVLERLSRDFPAAVALGWLALSCHSEGLGGSGHGAASVVTDTVTIEGGAMQTGFSNGPLRASRTVSGYRIAKLPVTSANFAACVKAGACESRDSSACADFAYAPYAGFHLPAYDKPADNAPVLCVGEDQAEAYCAWIGGQLPTLDQWLLAARGDSPHRYAWGDQTSTCDQHPLAPELIAFHGMSGAGSPPICDSKAFDGSELLVGTHPNGASPSGMQDALLAPGELLTTDSQSIFNACGSDFKHCVVFGLEPGAIDSVETFSLVDATKNDADAAVIRASVSHAYGFRCVLGAKKGG
jgi:hypothetical protein